MKDRPKDVIEGLILETEMRKRTDKRYDTVSMGESYVHTQRTEDRRSGKVGTGDLDGSSSCESRRTPSPPFETT